MVDNTRETWTTDNNNVSMEKQEINNWEQKNIQQIRLWVSTSLHK